MHDNSLNQNKDVGVVVIGRNEGERLKKCLDSIMGERVYVVYVDSGSTDGSVEYAKQVGADVIALDMSIPFTAARARDKGYQWLLERYPEIKYVQFVDGDCIMVENWISQARHYLESQRSTAVVFGLLKEINPEASIYNKMAQRSWFIPEGETETSGGIALFRTQAFDESGGFNESLIAGEEPELCLRLRRLGWKIYRLNTDMAWHDSNMFYFSQWWSRAVRTGHAFAEVYWLHRQFPEKYWRKHNISILFWGLLLPILILLSSLMHPALISVFLIYPVQVLRIGLHEGFINAFFWVLVKFPQGLGQLKYIYCRLINKKSMLIEYK